MKKCIFLFPIIFSFLYSFSQYENHFTRDLKLSDYYKRDVKYKGNDTIYYILINRLNDSTAVLKKYQKIKRSVYGCHDGTSIIEIGKFRNFFLYNNPFKKEKMMEKTGVWKEYDSNGNLIKTIDYSNVETYDGLGIKKSIRLFPYGRYSYIKRNNMNGIKNKNDN